MTGHPSPASFYFEGQKYGGAQGESVLTSLERHGVTIPSSCRSGVCQSCVLRVTEGAFPPSAQAGLKPAWKALGYVLSCMCPVREGLALQPATSHESVCGSIVRVEMLRPRVARVMVRVPEPFAYRAGQFVHLSRIEDGLTRAYSIASLPEEGQLELHVAVVEGGRMSRWLTGGAARELRVRGPCGECFYEGSRRDEPLLLVGTGTGLAPLLGVVRTAMAEGHTAAVSLYHATRRASDLYLLDELRALERRHPNLRVHALARANDTTRDDVRVGDVVAALEHDFPALAGYRVFLCGRPDVVRLLKRRSYLAGASLAAIHSDPFVLAPGVK